MEPHLYNVDISWTKERQGEMSSPELSTVIEIATPPQFPNGVEGIWSPEPVSYTHLDVYKRQV